MKSWSGGIGVSKILLMINHKITIYSLNTTNTMYNAVIVESDILLYANHRDTIATEISFFNTCTCMLINISSSFIDANKRNPPLSSMVSVWTNRSLISQVGDSSFTF